MPETNNQPSYTRQQSEPERSFRQLLHWMREKVSITNKTSDKTTRQSVSNPSSPTLVRAGRLRSASTGNIADTMENRNIQSPTPLIGEIPEQEQQRNLLNNRFGVSEDSISMHGFSTYVDPINGDDTGHHARVETVDVHAELRDVHSSATILS